MSTSTSDTLIEPPRSAHADEVIAALALLRGIGMGLAEGLAPAIAEGLSAADAALAYSRIARAVRLTCVLELRVAGEAAQEQAAQARARREAERLARMQAHENGYAAKQDAAMAVGMLLEDAARKGELSEREIEPLREQLETWTEDEDQELGFDALSEAEILESVCQALNLTPDPRLWAAGQLFEAIQVGLGAARTSGAASPTTPFDKLRRSSSFAKASEDRPATVETGTDRRWPTDLELADP